MSIPNHHLSSPQTERNFSSSINYDFWLIGGLSIVTGLFFVAFGGQIDKDLWQLAWALAFIINGPHFLVSYLLFYSLAKKRILTEQTLFVSGIGIPIILCLIATLSWVYKSPLLLSLLLFAMFFTVGWHYIKQGYGVLIVKSIEKKVFFNAQEQAFIKRCLYLLWIGSFLKIFESTSQLKSYWDFQYFVPPLPTWVAPIGETIALASIIPLIWLFIKRNRNGIKDNPSAMMGVFIQYIWLLPTLRHPQFILFVPLFHSLQYLVFAGNVAANIEKEKNHNKFLSRTVLRWWGSAFILAALLFEIIPKALDSHLTAPAELNTTYFFLIIFVVIINIHHFFIDSDLWRREVNLVRPYLKPINEIKDN